MLDNLSYDELPPSRHLCAFVQWTWRARETLKLAMETSPFTLNMDNIWTYIENYDEQVSIETSKQLRLRGELLESET